MHYPLPFLRPHKNNYSTQQNDANIVWEIEGCGVQRQKPRVRTWQKPFDAGSSAAPSEDGSEDDNSSPPHLLWDPRGMRMGGLGFDEFPIIHGVQTPAIPFAWLHHIRRGHIEKAKVIP